MSDETGRPPVQRGLELKSIGVRFGGLQALDDVSLTIPPGSVTGIIGPNGAGKTTLFNVICGFVRPDKGRITFSGQSLLGQRPHDLVGHGIARTMQAVGLWPGMTVVENVMTGGQSTVRSGFVSALLGLQRSSREERR